ncbi:MAG: L,D-transpeptidase family protein, partial [Sphingomonadales bacterium]
ALKSAATDAEVRRFYKVNGWHAVWSEQAGRALEEALAQRSAHGLDRIAFLDKPLDLQRPVDREIMLTRAALHYAMALASGWTDPAELHQIYTLARPKLDLRTSLSRALDRGALAQWFAGLAPQDKDYAILSKAYLAFRKEALLPSRPALGSSAIIQPGDDDIRIPAIRQQLAEGDYLPPQEGPTATANPAADRDPVSVTYEPDLVAAVKILQRDFGIAADGVIGPDTLALLNLRPGDRAQALAVALERRRWLARKPPATRIDVNIAAARLTYYRDGIVVDHRKVIVGRPGNETPQLLAPIYRLVANPTWTIPRSIQRGEMAGVSRAYLRSHNMVRRGGWIVQKSGPGNALGQVKFDMHDDQAIYLHDTSAPSLFARSERHLSHGCVRVDDALGFASLIAEDQGVTEKWTRAQNSGRQTFVALPHSIPVRLIYQNVFVDDASKVSFRTDPYAWNGPVAAALGFDNRSNAKARPEAIEVGP